MKGEVLQLNVSSDGMPKLPVLQARVTSQGVAGDWQKNRKYHGGPDRAVCLYSQELYDWLRTRGIDLVAGSIGENFTTLGIDLQTLKPGDLLDIGECRIEITSVRVPCRNLNRLHPQLLKIIEGQSGWLARVVRAGWVRPHDPIWLAAAQ